MIREIINRSDFIFDFLTLNIMYEITIMLAGA